MGHFGADIGSGMHELSKLILVKATFFITRTTFIHNNRHLPSSAKSASSGQGVTTQAHQEAISTLSSRYSLYFLLIFRFLNWTA